MPGNIPPQNLQYFSSDIQAPIRQHRLRRKNLPCAGGGTESLKMKPPQKQTFGSRFFQSALTPLTARPTVEEATA
jgi:hypothetical protein